MWQRLHDMKFGKAEAAAEGSIALFGQQMKDKDKKKKEKKKCDLSNVTCYSCGKKGPLKHMCLDKKTIRGRGRKRRPDRVR